MEIDIDGYLQDLKALAQRIAVAFEWHALAQQERGPRALPPFAFSDRNRQELDDLFSQFLFLCLRIRMVLDDPHQNCSAEQRAVWRRRLGELEDRVHHQARNQGFIYF